MTRQQARGQGRSAASKVYELTIRSLAEIAAILMVAELIFGNWVLGKQAPYKNDVRLFSDQ